ncbi:antitoxin HigA-1 [Gammaproteobacteria bacterium]
MTEEIFVTERPKRCPTHPGAVLHDTVLPALKISVTEAALELGISRQTLHRIMAGEISISPQMAVRLGRWCGNGSELWLRMQQAHDLWKAEYALKDELARIPRHSYEASSA